MKKISIVGGGVAALASALRLQHDGYDVTIYEKRDQLGGKMGQIKKDGFTFDLGPTIVMMPHIYEEALAYTGVDPKDYISFEIVDPMYEIHFSDGESLEASSDLVKLVKDLEKRGDDVAQGYLTYLNETYKKYLVAKDHFIEKSFRNPRDFYNFKTLRNALKLKTFDSAHHTIKKYVKDEKIQNMLSFQTLYIGISPKKGPSIYTIIPMIETIYGVHYSKGGMYSYVKALEKRFKELGGTVKLNSDVEEVVFEDKVVKGIKLKNEFIESDGIIMNADFPYAMNHLIKDPSVKGKYKEKYINNMDYSCSVFLLYLGINQKIDTLKLHNLYFGSDFDQNLEEIFKGKLPSDPAFYIYSPSRIDSSVAPNGKENLYVLVPIPENKTATYKWSDELKQNYRDKIIQKMAKQLNIEGFESMIESETWMTPDTFESELNAMFGATFGLAPTLKQSNYYRPKNVYPYAKNLYFAGSSVHPGAGVPIALTSGKITAEELKKDIK